MMMENNISEMDKWANERQRLAQAGQKTMQRLRESQAQLEQDRVDAQRYRKLKAELEQRDGNWFYKSLGHETFDAAVDALPEVPE